MDNYIGGRYSSTSVVGGRARAFNHCMLGDPTVHGDRSRRTRIDGTDGPELRNIHHVIGFVERRL